MKKAKGNASKVRTCKIQFAAQTNTARQHGYKPKGQICQVKKNAKVGKRWGIRARKIVLLMGKRKLPQKANKKN